MRPQRFICFVICLTDTRSPPDSLALLESSAVQERVYSGQTPAEMHGCLLMSWQMVSAEMDGR